MMWNINSNSLINTFVGHTGTVFGLYIGDSYNLFSGARDSTIKRWNIVSGTLVQTLTGHTDKVLVTVYFVIPYFYIGPPCDTKLLGFRLR